MYNPVVRVFWCIYDIGLFSQPWEEEEAQLQQEEQAEEQDYGPGIIKEAYHLDDLAKLITIEEVCVFQLMGSYVNVLIQRS